MHGLKTLVYYPHNITKSKVSMQSMSRLWNLDSFFLFGTFVPCPIKSQTNIEMTKKFKDRWIFPNTQTEWWAVVQWVQMGVSIGGAMHLHLADRWVLSGAGGVQAPWHSVLETMWLHYNKVQQVWCLRG